MITNKSFERHIWTNAAGVRQHVPLALRPGLERYINKGVPTGSFLEACISNDLRMALAKADADSAGANLAGAYLADAYLARADLARAYLARAYNVPGGVTQTDPPETYERKPAAERYAERAARFRERNPDVPVIPNIDAQILAAVEANPGALEMGSWHTCKTTHCRAGWAIHLAGEAGYALEKKYNAEQAGRMIYLASTGRVPHFYATNASALEDIRECAAQQNLLSKAGGE